MCDFLPVAHSYLDQTYCNFPFIRRTETLAALVIREVTI